jgi:hypothetical protein
MPPLTRGDALSTLAEVLDHADRREEAVEALGQALAEYERKPIIPRARVTRARIAELQKAPARTVAESASDG